VALRETEVFSSFATHFMQRSGQSTRALFDTTGDPTSQSTHTLRSGAGKKREHATDYVSRPSLRSMTTVATTPQKPSTGSSMFSTFRAAKANAEAKLESKNTPKTSSGSNITATGSGMSSVQSPCPTESRQSSTTSPSSFGDIASRLLRSLLPWHSSPSPSEPASPPPAPPPPPQTSVHMTSQTLSHPSHPDNTAHTPPSLLGVQLTGSSNTSRSQSGATSGHGGKSKTSKAGTKAVSNMTSGTSGSGRPASATDATRSLIRQRGTKVAANRSATATAAAAALAAAVLDMGDSVEAATLLSGERRRGRPPKYLKEAERQLQMQLQQHEQEMLRRKSLQTAQKQQSGTSSDSSQEFSDSSEAYEDSDDDDERAQGSKSRSRSRTGRYNYRDVDDFDYATLFEGPDGLPNIDELLKEQERLQQQLLEQLERCTSNAPAKRGRPSKAQREQEERDRERLMELQRRKLSVQLLLQQARARLKQREPDLRAGRRGDSNADSISTSTGGSPSGAPKRGASQQGESKSRSRAQKTIKSKSRTTRKSKASKAKSKKGGRKSNSSAKRKTSTSQSRGRMGSNARGQASPTSDSPEDDDEFDEDAEEEGSEQLSKDNDNSEDEEYEKSEDDEEAEYEPTDASTSSEEYASSSPSSEDSNDVSPLSSGEYEVSNQSRGAPTSLHRQPSARASSAAEHKSSLARLRVDTKAEPITRTSSTTKTKRTPGIGAFFVTGGATTPHSSNSNPVSGATWETASTKSSSETTLTPMNILTAGKGFHRAMVVYITQEDRIAMGAWQPNKLRLGMSLIRDQLRSGQFLPRTPSGGTPSATASGNGTFDLEDITIPPGVGNEEVVGKLIAATITTLGAASAYRRPQSTDGDASPGHGVQEHGLSSTTVLPPSQQTVLGFVPVVKFTRIVAQQPEQDATSASPELKPTKHGRRGGSPAQSPQDLKRSHPVSPGSSRSPIRGRAASGRTPTAPGHPVTSTHMGVHATDRLPYVHDRERISYPWLVHREGLSSKSSTVHWTIGHTNVKAVKSDQASALGAFPSSAFMHQHVPDEQPTIKRVKRSEQRLQPIHELSEFETDGSDSEHSARFTNRFKKLAAASSKTSPACHASQFPVDATGKVVAEYRSSPEEKRKFRLRKRSLMSAARRTMHWAAYSGLEARLEWTPTRALWLDPNDLVGRAVRFYSPAHQGWFVARVMSYNPRTSLHLLAIATSDYPVAKAPEDAEGSSSQRGASSRRQGSRSKSADSVDEGEGASLQSWKEIWDKWYDAMAQVHNNWRAEQNHWRMRSANLAGEPKAHSISKTSRKGHQSRSGSKSPLLVPETSNVQVLEKIPNEWSPVLDDPKFMPEPVYPVTLAAALSAFETTIAPPLADEAGYLAMQYQPQMGALPALATESAVSASNLAANGPTAGPSAVNVSSRSSSRSQSPIPPSVVVSATSTSSSSRRHLASTIVPSPSQSPAASTPHTLQPGPVLRRLNTSRGSTTASPQPPSRSLSRQNSTDSPVPPSLHSPAGAPPTSNTLAALPTPAAILWTGDSRIRHALTTAALAHDPKPHTQAPSSVVSSGKLPVRTLPPDEVLDPRFYAEKLPSMTFEERCEYVASNHGVTVAWIDLWSLPALEWLGKQEVLSASKRATLPPPKSETSDVALPLASLAPEAACGECHCCQISGEREDSHSHMETSAQLGRKRVRAELDPRNKQTSKHSTTIPKCGCGCDACCCCECADKYKGLYTLYRSFFAHSGAAVCPTRFRMNKESPSDPDGWPGLSSIPENAEVDIRTHNTSRSRSRTPSRSRSRSQSQGRVLSAMDGSDEGTSAAQEHAEEEVRAAIEVGLAAIAALVPRALPQIDLAPLRRITANDIALGLPVSPVDAKHVKSLDAAGSLVVSLVVATIAAARELGVVFSPSLAAHAAVENHSNRNKRKGKMPQASEVDSDSPVSMTAADVVCIVRSILIEAALAGGRLPLEENDSIANYLDGASEDEGGDLRDIDLLSDDDFMDDGKKSRGGLRRSASQKFRRLAGSSTMSPTETSRTPSFTSTLFNLEGILLEPYQLAVSVATTTLARGLSPNLSLGLVGMNAVASKMSGRTHIPRYHCCSPEASFTQIGACLDEAIETAKSIVSFATSEIPVTTQSGQNDAMNTSASTATVISPTPVVLGAIPAVSGGYSASILAGPLPKRGLSATLVRPGPPMTNLMIQRLGRKYRLSDTLLGIEILRQRIPKEITVAGEYADPSQSNPAAKDK